MKKSYDSKFKSRVALEALRGELTVAEIASSDSSEFGSTMEEETLRECLRSLLDQSGVKNRQQALYRRRSDEKDRPA